MKVLASSISSKEKWNLSKEEWKSRLSPEAYYIHEQYLNLAENPIKPTYNGSDKVRYSDFLIVKWRRPALPLAQQKLLTVSTQHSPTH